MGCSILIAHWFLTYAVRNETVVTVGEDEVILRPCHTSSCSSADIWAGLKAVVPPALWEAIFDDPPARTWSLDSTRRGTMLQLIQGSLRTFKCVVRTCHRLRYFLQVARDRLVHPTVCKALQFGKPSLLFIETIPERTRVCQVLGRRARTTRRTSCTCPRNRDAGMEAM